MIYLDNAATTPIDPMVLDAMLPYLREWYGNPNSLHALGRQARAAVENARKQVARFLNAEPEQIVFTSGGTEANNMVFTISQHFLSEKGRKHIVISAIEHDSVLKSAQNLCIKHGFDITQLNVNSLGRVHAGSLKYAIHQNTGLVSVMYMNNEIGSSNHIDVMAKLCHENDILFHTDCVQAAGCRPIDVKKVGCDFATISSHKIHGPKGVGAIYIKDKSLFGPMIHGGSSQEFGMRGGTENVAGIVGFGAACELLTTGDIMGNVDSLESLKSEFSRSMYMELEKCGFLERVILNGSSELSSKVLNFRADGVDAETLVLMLDSAGVCVSAGSACNSHEQVPSHVLLAMGLTEEQARSSFRVSVSRMNTLDEMKKAGKIVADCICALLSGGV